MSTPTSSTARLEREQWRAKIQRAIQELRGSVDTDDVVRHEARRSSDPPSSAFDPSG